MTGSGIKKGGDRPGGGMTPLMHQYFDIKRQHADALVLFRMGDFYETFDDDAKKASKILGITLTKRANGAAADVPLAGFPHHALDSYLPKLTEAGLRVAICEQVEDPKLAKGLVRREVVEVVTPGTAFSESYPDQKTNNFLGGIAYGRDRVGFAFLDHSTGEFYVGESSGNDIGETLAKFSPREMIVQEDLKFQEKEWVKKNRPFITEMDVWAFDYGASREALLNHFGTTSLQGFGCDQFTAGISAAGVILRYVERNIRGSLDHVTKLTPIADDGVMGLDEFTIRNLELFNSLATQGTHGTLMGVLDQTVTPGGGRLLRQWLNRPLTDRSRIEARLACVEGFVTDPQARGKVRRELALACDMERVVGKLSRGRGTPRDVASLRNTLSLVPVLRQLLADLESSALRGLSRRLDDTSGIAADMGDTLVESPPPSLADGGVVLDGLDDELDELRTIARGGKDWIA
ncbi:MAG: DNA mismatch repair protein MutS, partial [Fidelibacterota bacterium]